VAGEELVVESLELEEEAGSGACGY
jgi:hypothetical protein